MKITYLEIVGFKRFRLNGIKKFVMKPNQPVQLILGTNGSGKSSLMGELTPLPAEQSNYHKDGYKIIHITKGNNKYILKSELGASHPHSFILNDQELNDGGTITVQREFVRQHFGITPEIQNLLLGLETFTGMSPARRREWFTTLSEVSYDYALGVYAKLREKYRDTSGALKHAKKRLVQEKSKIISSSELDKIKAEVDQIHKELDLLFQNRNAVTRSEEQVKRDITTSQQELQTLLNQFNRIRLQPPNTNLVLNNELIRNEWGELVPVSFKGKDDIDYAISQNKASISFKEQLIQERESRFSEISKKIAILEKTGEEGVRSIREKIKVNEIKLKDLKTKLRIGLESFYTPTVSDTFNAISDTLFEIFSILPSNADRRLSSQKLRELTEELTQLNQVIRKFELQIEKIRNEVEHLKKHKDAGNIVCPACKHTWNPKFTLSDLPSLEALLEKEVSAIKEKENAKKKLEESINENKEYGDLVRRYFQCVKTTPSLLSLWNYINEKDLVYSGPKKILVLLEDVRFDLHIQEEIYNVEKTIIDLTELAKASEKLGDESIIELKVQYKEIETDIATYTQALGVYKQNLSICQNYRKNISTAEDISFKIKALMSQSELLQTELIEAIRHECINLCIREHQSNLAVKERIVSSVTVQQSLISDLESQIVSLSKEEEVTKHLINELSPTSGLIAEGLLGFIRFCLKRMNNIIKKIWTYSMVVESCHVGDDTTAELDYKFPVRIERGEKPIEDVKLGSTGMKEVIDLSFKLCAMHFLSLDHIPLTLDEFGRTMDKTHKEQATHFIQEFLNQSVQPQIFMVSHDLLQYGSISNVDVCVLCPSNIVVPNEYNEHVVIEA